MKKSNFMLLSMGLVCACASSQQIQKNSDSAFQKENQLWSELGEKAAKECPKEISRKTQIAREDCIEALIRKDVRPYVSYPLLVDYMLTKTREEAQKYAAGKISEETYIKNVKLITEKYWDYWMGPRDEKIADTDPNVIGYQGMGDALLLGVQTTARVLRDHQQAAKENAERNRPIRCTTYKSVTTCY